MELFKLKSIGLIQSVPERFLYHDKPKIVKPMLSHEAQVLLQLLTRIKPHTPLEVRPNSLPGYQAITLDLASYGGELFREKILEAWLMENVTGDGPWPEAHENLKAIFGNVDNFANSIFTYYTNFMDVLFYNDSRSPLQELCSICGMYTSKNKEEIAILELKKGCFDLGAVHQLREYRDWALKALGNNDNSKIKLFGVAASFRASVSEESDIIRIRYILEQNPPHLRLERLSWRPV